MLQLCFLPPGQAGTPGQCGQSRLREGNAARSRSSQQEPQPPGILTSNLSPFLPSGHSLRHESSSLRCLSIRAGLLADPSSPPPLAAPGGSVPIGAQDKAHSEPPIPPGTACGDGSRAVGPRVPAGHECHYPYPQFHSYSRTLRQQMTRKSVMSQASVPAGPLARAGLTLSITQSPKNISAREATSIPLRALLEDRQQHWDRDEPDPAPGPCVSGDTPDTAGLRGTSAAGTARPAGSQTSHPAPPPPFGCGLCQGMLDCKLTVSSLHGPGSICRK